MPISEISVDCDISVTRVTNVTKAKCDMLSFIYYLSLFYVKTRNAENTCETRFTHSNLKIQFTA